MRALSVFAGTQAILVFWGLASGNSPSSVVQDIRPLLGYAVGLGGLALGRSAKGVRLLAGVIVLSGAFIAVLVIAVVAGLLTWEPLVNAAGRPEIRNGVLWVLAVPLGLQYALSSKESAGVRLTAGMLLLVCIAGVVWSGSRSLWVAVPLSMLYQVAILATDVRRRSQVRGAAVVFAVLVSLLIVAGSLTLGSGRLPAPIAERVSSFLSLETDSSLGTRLVNYTNAASTFMESPIVARGLGARVTLYGRSNVAYTEEGQYVDNTLLTILMKGGLLGLAGFAWLLFVAASGVRRASASTGNPLMVAAESSIPGMVVLMAASSVLVAYAEIAVFALVFGVAFGICGEATE